MTISDTPKNGGVAIGREATLISPEKLGSDNIFKRLNNLYQPCSPHKITKILVMKKIKIGDKLRTKHRVHYITEIEMVEPGKSDDGIPMAEIWECDKDRCVFSLDNGHWAYGDESEIVS